MPSASHSLPGGFDNLVRLFPLPNLVLFPGQVQALHIFESRYRQMMADALNSDQLISMALLRPNDGEILEPVFSTICIGQIATHVKMPDGRYNLILAGIRRAIIVDEILFQTPYRMAKVELAEETAVDTPAVEKELKEKIVGRFRSKLSPLKDSAGNVTDDWLNLELPLGNLCDVVTFSCGVEPLLQQQVLEQFDIRRRAELVLEILDQQSRHPVPEKFPPDFSVN